MSYLFQCNRCGNPRDLLSPTCPFCGESSPPYPHTNYRKVNLEEDSPTVEDALTKLEQFIHISVDVGLKVIIIIHGYGSSGKGGSIKNAVRQELQNNRWADCVREFVYGEQLRDQASIREKMHLSKSLEKNIMTEGVLKNPGSTLLLLYRKRLIKA